MSNFRPESTQSQTAYLLPPSVEDWLPKDHLARFVVDVVEQLDLSAMSKAYRGSGLGQLSSLPVGWASGLRLRDGRVFEPQARARSNWSPSALLRPIKIPITTQLRPSADAFERDRSVVRQGFAFGSRDGAMLRMGTVALDGTKSTPMPASTARSLLRACVQNRGAAEGRGC